MCSLSRVVPQRKWSLRGVVAEQEEGNYIPPGEED